MKRIVDIPDYSLDEVQNGSIACEQILKAVKNSKPISTENDLISREYLKDAFDNLCCHNCKTCRNFRIEGCSFYRCALIENAPTVKFSLMPADETKEDAYKRGYERGKIAGILEANTRPQGEWIEKVERRGCFAGDKTVYSYTCPFCGAIEFKKYPFCHCGADLRKGGAE